MPKVKIDTKIKQGLSVTSKQYVQMETLDYVQSSQDLLSIYRKSAEKNHRRWQEAHDSSASQRSVRVVQGDWATEAHKVSQNGQVYAILAASDPCFAGGSYLLGGDGEEEDVLRRTDCHAFIEQADVLDGLIGSKLPYQDHMRDILEAKKGYVYLDTETPRLCFRGQEMPGLANFRILPVNEMFLFYEMKAAPVDLRKYGSQALRDSTPDDESLMRQKIQAQLNVLVEQGVRHVILRDFGCQKFGWSAAIIAQMYAQELDKYGAYFDDVVFVLAEDVPPNNVSIFKEHLNDKTLNSRKELTELIDHMPIFEQIKECLNVGARLVKRTVYSEKFFAVEPPPINTGFQQIATILDPDYPRIPLELKLQNIIAICSHFISAQESGMCVGIYDQIRKIAENPALYNRQVTIVHDANLGDEWVAVEVDAPQLY